MMILHRLFHVSCDLYFIITTVCESLVLSTVIIRTLYYYLQLRALEAISYITDPKTSPRIQRKYRNDCSISFSRRFIRTKMYIAIFVLDILTVIGAFFLVFFLQAPRNGFAGAQATGSDFFLTGCYSHKMFSHPLNLTRMCILAVKAVVLAYIMISARIYGQDPGLSRPELFRYAVFVLPSAAALFAAHALGDWVLGYHFATDLPMSIYVLVIILSGVILLYLPVRTHHTLNRQSEEWYLQGRLADIANLSDVLHSKVGFGAFSEFLRSEFSEENINFWKEVNDFVAGCTEQMAYKHSKLNFNQLVLHKIRTRHLIVKAASRAIEIFFTYCQRGAPQQVNISDTELQALVKQLRKVNQRAEVVLERILFLFDSAQSQVFELMDKDSFARFRQSEACEEMKRRLIRMGWVDTTSGLDLRTFGLPMSMVQLRDTEEERLLSLERKRYAQATLPELERQEARDNLSHTMILQMMQLHRRRLCLAGRVPPPHPGPTAYTDGEFPFQLTWLDPQGKPIFTDPVLRRDFRIVEDYEKLGKLAGIFNGALERTERLHEELGVVSPPVPPKYAPTSALATWRLTGPDSEDERTGASPPTDDAEAHFRLSRRLRRHGYYNFGRKFGGVLKIDTPEAQAIIKMFSKKTVSKTDAQQRARTHSSSFSDSEESENNGNDEDREAHVATESREVDRQMREFADNTLDEFSVRPPVSQFQLLRERIYSAARKDATARSRRMEKNTQGNRSQHAEVFTASISPSEDDSDSSYALKPRKKLSRTSSGDETLDAEHENYLPSFLQSAEVKAQREKEVQRAQKLHDDLRRELPWRRTAQDDVEDALFISKYGVQTARDSRKVRNLVADVSSRSIKGMESDGKRKERETTEKSSSSSQKLSEIDLSSLRIPGDEAVRRWKQYGLQADEKNREETILEDLDDLDIERILRDRVARHQRSLHRRIKQKTANILTSNRHTEKDRYSTESVKSGSYQFTEIERVIMSGRKKQNSAVSVSTILANVRRTEAETRKRLISDLNNDNNISADEDEEGSKKKSSGSLLDIQKFIDNSISGQDRAQGEESHIVELNDLLNRHQRFNTFGRKPYYANNRDEGAGHHRLSQERYQSDDEGDSERFTNSLSDHSYGDYSHSEAGRSSCHSSIRSDERDDNENVDERTTLVNSRARASDNVTITIHE